MQTGGIRGYLLKSWRLGIVFVCTVGIALSVLLCLSLLQRQDEKLQRDLDAVASARFRAFAERVEMTVGVLASIERFLLASEEVSREEFRLFAGASVRERPGVWALAWAPFVAGVERSTVVEEARREGMAGFDFSEPGPAGALIEAGIRPYHAPLLYVEPLASNEAALGLDLLSEPVRSQAFLRARETRDPVATGIVPLLTGEQDGVLLLHPVFSGPGAANLDQAAPMDGFEGVVVGVLNVGEVLREAMAVAADQKVDVQITDLAAAPDTRVLALHSAEPRLTLPGGGPDLVSRQSPEWQRAFDLGVADRTWRVMVAATPGFIDDGRSALPWAVLALGLVATAAMAGYVYLVRTGLVRAQRDAAEIRAAKLVLEREIEERSRAEEMARRGQKLEAVAQLAGGIAHDFNNLLAAVLGSVVLVRREIKDPGALSHNLDDNLATAEEACLRARDLARRLLTFAKAEEPERVVTAIAELVDAAVRFALSGSNHTATIELEEPLWPAEVDQTQITQVIDNLMINATEAMEAPGRITLNVRNEHLTEHDAPGLSPGPYIVIRVKDEGLGIPLEHRKLLFDPFFSTKPAGSGLGLPTSLRIAERHGGTLLLEASGPAGSTFVLYLPAVPLAQAAVAEAQPQAGAGLGRALIIDDEPNVRKVLTRMLASLGWTAEEAGSGERGLEILAHAPVAEIAYDLVITDLTMPGGMGGVEVAKAIRERGEGVPVVLSSGYSPESTLPEDSLALFAARLGKPYTLEELRRVLVSVVGAGGCV